MTAPAPVRELWLAVIDQAIADYLNGPCCTEQKLFPEEMRAKFCADIRAAAADWLLHKAGEPRTFLWACDELELPGEAMQARFPAMLAAGERWERTLK